MPYIYSTLSQSNAYVTWDKAPGGKLVKKKVIVIKGGANIFVDKYHGTPLGHVTTVSDEELKNLEENPVFKNHVNRGFIIVDNKKKNPDLIAKKMESKDNSAQKIRKDFKDIEVTTKDK